jgi:hypothetical protein
MCAHSDSGKDRKNSYWYGRAGKPVCREPLEAEWLSIVKDFFRKLLNRALPKTRANQSFSAGCEAVPHRNHL